ncbi:MAG TPA: hypothetical protein VFI47_14690, partial [Acidimicrobiales bacterium]|nr:hypothetical protein [Acidimicrobiales bacterium]
FYVFKRDGYEERHWLPANTGYPVAIRARRLLGANARPRDGQAQSGLEWIDWSDLCDTARPETGCAPPPAPPPAPPAPAAAGAPVEATQAGPTPEVPATPLLPALGASERFAAPLLVAAAPAGVG